MVPRVFDRGFYGRRDFACSAAGIVVEAYILDCMELREARRRAWIPSMVVREQRLHEKSLLLGGDDEIITPSADASQGRRLGWPGKL